MDIGKLLEVGEMLARILAYAVAIASIIVKATPTLKDNNVLLPIIKILGKYISLSRKTKDDVLRK